MGFWKAVLNELSELSELSAQLEPTQPEMGKIYCPYCERWNTRDHETCNGCGHPLDFGAPENILPDQRPGPSIDLGELHNVKKIEKTNKSALGFTLYNVYTPGSTFFMGEYTNEKGGLKYRTKCHRTVASMLAEVRDYNDKPFSVDDLGFVSETFVEEYNGWKLYNVATKYGNFYRARKRNAATYLFKTMRPIKKRIDNDLYTSEQDLGYDRRAFDMLRLNGGIFDDGQIHASRLLDEELKCCRKAFDVIEPTEKEIAHEEWKKRHPRLASILYDTAAEKNYSPTGR